METGAMSWSGALVCPLVLHNLKKISILIERIPHVAANFCVTLFVDCKEPMMLRNLGHRLSTVGAVHIFSSEKDYELFKIKVEFSLHAL